MPSHTFNKSMGLETFGREEVQVKGKEGYGKSHHNTSIAELAQLLCAAQKTSKQAPSHMNNLLHLKQTSKQEGMQ
jgi:hypothetical protein